MTQQSIGHCDTLHLRQLELRDFQTAGEIVPGATSQLRDRICNTAISLHEEVALGRCSAWIAEVEDELIGIAILTVESDALARFACLHVAPGVHLDSSASALAAAVIREAWSAGCLKLAVPAHIAVVHDLEYMRGLGFEFARSHGSGSAHVIEFYRNLYQPPKDQPFQLAGLESV